MLKDQLVKDITTSLFARPVDGTVQQDSYDDYNIFTDSQYNAAGDPLELRAEASARSSSGSPAALY